MLAWKTKLLTICSLCSLFFPTTVPVLAQTTVENTPTTTASGVYQQAKEKLPSDLYAIYRIVDRIARANEIDSHPWQVKIVRKYDIYSFASEENLITIHSSVLNQLVADSSALACLVGHEMGHHVKRHTVVGETQKAELLAKIKEEAEQEVLGTKKTSSTESTVSYVGGAIANHVLPGFLGNLVNGVLERRNTNRAQQVEKRIKEIIAQKTEDLNQRLALQTKEQELEADQMGYLTSIRAGFEPEGCLRALDILAKTPEFETAIAPTSIRIESLKDFMTKNPPQTLAQEGEARISATQPLTYDLSKNGESLKINSRHGASVADDIDAKFGK
ncbi:M48 family metalloprotease [Scytonema sp. UIC 10036]|uniref:M48 family metalloprotease n=1 Tax=Scytonema sp. UIC 10036 TaxID=2304196 RepID=UPI0012DA86C7|nr:M48 family metalloprotease [Scytonema sp. UIC 10036]MUG97160.1 M48 family metalloprotease [Scytonema sp. UIC 10036]